MYDKENHMNKFDFIMPKPLSNFIKNTKIWENNTQKLFKTIIKKMKNDNVVKGNNDFLENENHIFNKSFDNT